MTDHVDAYEQKFVRVANQFAEFLLHTQLKVVFAESCTAGLLSTMLSRTAGISTCLCGSLVTYQNDSKVRWLGVDQQDLDAPAIGPVSQTVAEQMALGALAATPLADIAISVTGHLGPQAPAHLDGVAFTAIARRRTSVECHVTQLKLVAGDFDDSATDVRLMRQLDAALQVLQIAQASLQSDPAV